MARSGRRRKRGGHSEEGGSNERWLITYSDLITLLMIFFILMYTMSQVDAQKYAAVANSLSVVLTGQAMSVLDTQGPSLIEGLSGQDMPQNQDNVEQGQLDEVKKLVSEFIEAKDQEAQQGTTNSQIIKLSEHIIVYEQERGLVISFKDALLFPSGSDQLTPLAAEIIAEVGKTLVGLPNYIRVEGHTDNLPISTNRFASNWELSVMRSATVVHVLSEAAQIPAERLAIIGYGEYRPLVPNESESYRAMNRRVDIVILKKKYDYFEPPRMEANPTGQAAVN